MPSVEHEVKLVLDISRSTVCLCWAGEAKGVVTFIRMQVLLVSMQRRQQFGYKGSAGIACFPGLCYNDARDSEGIAACFSAPCC